MEVEWREWGRERKRERDSFFSLDLSFDDVC